MEKLYHFLEDENKSSFWKFIFRWFPFIEYILEKRVFKHYWNKIILPELIENDEIFAWFDRNDFEIYQDKYFRTIGIIDEYEILRGKTFKQIKQHLISDYTPSLMNVLKNNSNLNIEDYLMLDVIVEKREFKIYDSIYFQDIFEVSIKYIRYPELIAATIRTNIFLKRLLLIIAICSVTVLTTILGMSIM